jgi:hypothetical protein
MRRRKAAKRLRSRGGLLLGPAAGPSPAEQGPRAVAPTTTGGRNRMQSQHRRSPDAWPTTMVRCRIDIALHRR